MTVLNNDRRLKCIIAKNHFARISQKTERNCLRQIRDLKSFRATSHPFSFSLEILVNMFKKNTSMLLFHQYRNTCVCLHLHSRSGPKMRHQMYSRIGQKRKEKLVEQAENTNTNWFIHPNLPYFLLSSFFFLFWRSSNGKKLNNSAALICTHKWEFISIFDFFPPSFPFCKSASIKIYLGVQMCWNRLKGNLSALSKHKCRCCEVN